MNTPIWREGWNVGYDPDLDRGYVHHHAAGIDVTLQFQHGPVQEVGGINGIQNEELITLLIMRLKALDLRLPCDENRETIRALEQAADWLAIRTSKRVAQGIEGTERPHSSSEEIPEDPEEIS